MAGLVAMRYVGARSSRRSGLGMTAALYNEMALLRNSMLQNMREEAPVNKNPNAPNRGALRKSLRASPWVSAGGVWRTQFSALDYIHFVIKDTKPHVIRPRTPGGVLAIGGPIGVSRSLAPVSFLSRSGTPGRLGRKGGPSIFKAPAGYAALRGDTLYLAFVNHPGTKANNFVERAVTKTFVIGTPGLTKRVQAAIEAELLSAVVV